MSSSSSSHQHPHLRLSIPVRTPFPSLPSPFPTPSKTKALASATDPFHRRAQSPSSLPSLLLLLFSLRSLYSLLPFLRSSPPSFSLFPFSFLVSLLSLLTTSLLSPSSPPLPSLSPSPLLPPLAVKSLLLSLVFLLRFHALRSCGTSATILAEFSGSLAARSLSSAPRNPTPSLPILSSLLLLAFGWDRQPCSPLSPSPNPTDCRKLLPILVPFLSGFLGFFERSARAAPLRQLGRRRVRVLCLALTTAFLFPPALLSFLLSPPENLSLLGLGWPLINTVVFGVVLGENNGDEKGVSSSKDLQREFLVTFGCTLALELFYFPELSLPGFLLCGFLIWIAVRLLAYYSSSSSSSGYVELGSDEGSGSLYSMIRDPIRHILSERKSRKIALFLLINTAYMVVEFVAGFMSNSLGLISDACHMLFDCAALAIGLYASYISRLPANGQFNYGRGRVEVLSGYVNAVFLVLVGALIVLESFERILDPQDISTNSLLSVSVGGLLVNLVGLVFFHEEHHHAHGGGSCTHYHSHSHTDTHLHLKCHHDHSHDCSNAHSHEHHRHNHHEHSHDHHSDRDSHGGHHHGHYDHSHNHHSNSDLHGHHDHDHHDHSHNNQSNIHSQEHHHHEHHVHSHHNHGHSHEHVVHEHIPAENNYKHTDCSLENPYDVGNRHSHDDHGHHHHHNQSNCIVHKEAGESDHKNRGCEYDHDHHSHHAVNHRTSNKAECEHLNHERALNISHTHGHGGHPDEKMHGDGKCCDHHHSHHLSVTTDNVRSSHSKEISSTGKTNGGGKHHHIDHNMEGIFLHVLADTMGSVGVVISTLLIKYKGWLAADPACSIFISIMIISSVLPLLRNSAEILMQRVSRAHQHDLRAAIDEVMNVKGVCGIQNIHVWSFTNTEVVGTIHLQISPGADMASAKKQVSNILHDIGVKDLTIQTEYV